MPINKSGQYIVVILATNCNYSWASNEKPYTEAKELMVSIHKDNMARNIKNQDLKLCVVEEEIKADGTTR